MVDRIDGHGASVVYGAAPTGDITLTAANFPFASGAPAGGAHLFHPHLDHAGNHIVQLA